jgi:hypothetical protein
MIRVVVSTPTQVRFEGRAYGPGDEIEAPEEAARKWLAAGWVSAVSHDEAKDTGVVESEAPPEVKPKNEGVDAGRDERP